MLTLVQVLEIRISASKEWDAQTDRMNKWHELTQEYRDVLLARAVESYIIDRIRHAIDI